MCSPTANDYNKSRSDTITPQSSLLTPHSYISHTLYIFPVDCDRSIIFR